MPDRVFQFSDIIRHVAISHETFSKLSLYHELLLKWQSKINLVGSNTLHGVWQRHFLDSLQLLNVIEDTSSIMVDLGTGAGFPGMVLAICGANNMHLIDSDAKKIAFLKEVARITKTKVQIHRGRIEQCAIDKVVVIVSRACAKLDTLLSLSSHLISHETICFFHKGKNYTKEINDAKKEWAFEKCIIPSITDTQGVIIKLSHIRRRENDQQQGRSG